MKVRQRYFWFNDAHDKPLPRRPIFVDGFAGGGGASLGIERALGQQVDVAINHNQAAIAMHMANHPQTKHYCENIWTVDPVAACEGRQVLGAWFSPDCTHFAKARGTKPVKKYIRGLAWVVVKWAEMPKRLRPRVIFIENVEEFLTWGPVDKKTKRPIPEKAGVTFELWVWKLRELGYNVEWRILHASDFGAPTTRKRLFIVCRCDGKPIKWPAPTHGSPAQIKKDFKKNGFSRRKPWRSAAECIDFNDLGHSIFLSPEEAKEVGCNRPLVDNTMTRIAYGVRRFVIETNDPFIVRPNHGGDHFRGQSIRQPLGTMTQSQEYALIDPVLAPYGMALQHGGSARRLDDPWRTITASRKDCNLVVTPTLVQTGYGERPGQRPRYLDIHKPLGTVVAGGEKHAIACPLIARQFGKSIGSSIEVPIGTACKENKSALVSAFIAKHFGGVVGVPADVPFPTITTRGTQNQFVSCLIKNTHGDKSWFDGREPLRTILAQGTHHGLVTARVSQVRAFLFRYFGSGGQWSSCHDPLPTITTRDRLALGLVLIDNELWQIIDILMRMLTPEELFRCQGFPRNYVINVGLNGRPASKKDMVARCGNSVSPHPAEALVRANLGVDRV